MVFSGNPKAASPEAASFYQVAAVSLDMEGFFKKQVEECLELERQAFTAEDRAFWRQAADRWNEALRQSRTQAQTSKKAAGVRAARASFKYTAEA